MCGALRVAIARYQRMHQVDLLRAEDLALSAGLPPRRQYDLQARISSASPPPKQQQGQVVWHFVPPADSAAIAVALLSEKIQAGYHSGQLGLPVGGLPHQVPG